MNSINNNLTDKEFKAVHLILDSLNQERRATAASLHNTIRPEKVKEQILDLFERQDIDIQKTILDKHLATLDVEQSNDTLTVENVKTLLLHHKEQKEWSNQYFESQEHQKQMEAVSGFFLSEAHAVFRNMEIAIQDEKMGIERFMFWKTIAYLNSNVDPKLISKNFKIRSFLNKYREKSLIWGLPFLAVVAHMPHLSPLAMGVTAIAGWALIPISHLVVEKLAGLLSKSPSPDKEEDSSCLFSIEGKEMTSEMEVFKNAKKLLNMENLNWFDVAPDNEATRIFIELVAKDHMGLRILNGLAKRKTKMTVFDLGLLGISFPELCNIKEYYRVKEKMEMDAQIDEVEKMLSKSTLKIQGENYERLQTLRRNFNRISMFSEKPKEADIIERYES